MLTENTIAFVFPTIFYRNQKLAAEHAIEIQQKCLENFTLTVEYCLPILQLFLTFI